MDSRVGNGELARMHNQTQICDPQLTLEDLRMVDNHAAQASNAQEQAKHGAGKNAGPTEEERANLVRDLQTHAMERKQDPMAAGVELLCGDLMAFAFLVRKAIDEDSRNPVTSAGFKKFERKAELLLRLSRQIDRFAQIRRQMSSESEK